VDEGDLGGTRGEHFRHSSDCNLVGGLLEKFGMPTLPNADMKKGGGKDGGAWWNDC